MENQALYGLQIISSFRAPKLEKGKDEISYKTFKKDEIVQGYKQNRSSLPNTHVEAFVTKDGYLLPTTSVYVLGVVEDDTPPIQEAVVVEDKDLMKKETLQKLEKVGDSQPSKVIESLKTRNKTAINGAMVGAGAGLLYAMLRGKNKMMLLALGAVAGYAVGNMIAKTNEK